MNQLEKRLLEICYKHKLHHIGSYFSSLEIIDQIYKTKNEEDIFILSSGHAVVALYVILEKYYDLDAEKLLDDHGEHPHRSEKDRIYCSTGSLGMGITVAVGRALGNTQRKVHCLISDGECSEGSVWESLRFIEDYAIDNIVIHVNANGWAAYDSVDVDILEKRLRAFHKNIVFHKTKVEYFGFTGLEAHYKTLNESQYLKALSDA